MKEKLHNGPPNLILKTIKKLILSLLISFGVINSGNAQNPNANENATVDGGNITTLDGETYIDVCVGDGVADYVDVILENESGRVKQWIITDDQNNILALPEAPPFDFDEAPPGNCRIWHLSYNGIKPLVTPFWHKHNKNLSDLTGKFDLSNYIEVERFQQPVEGILEGGPFEFCVGDEEADHIAEGAITLSGNMGTNSAWVITDVDGNILELPDNYADVNFDEADAGTCLVWHLSYEDNVSLDITNASELTGCFALSNPITVDRYQQPVGGTLEGGPFDFCVGDGVEDLILEGEITLSGNMGTNATWVVTDADGNILELPGNYTDVNFDEAEAGTCLIWYLSYENNVSLDGITNANELSGCYALTNPITVNRTEINGGTISGGEEDSFSFTVGDGTEDKITADAITLEGNIGTNSAWVVTNEDGTVILELPENYSDVDFDESGAGTCKIWHLSYEDGLEGLTPPDEGDHLVSGLGGACFDLSNSISVERTTESSRVAIFPNPTKNEVNVNFAAFSEDQVNISVFNLRNVQLNNKNYNSGSKRAVLDVSRYENGVYFILITNRKTGDKLIKRLVVN